MATKVSAFWGFKIGFLCEKDVMEWDEVKGRNCVFIGRGNVVVKALGGTATNRRVDPYVCNSIQ